MRQFYRAATASDLLATHPACYALPIGLSDLLAFDGLSPGTVAPTLIFDLHNAPPVLLSTSQRALTIRRHKAIASSAV